MICLLVFGFGLLYLVWLDFYVLLEFVGGKYSEWF